MLEAESIEIFRAAAADDHNPLLHVDTTCKSRDMYAPSKTCHFERNEKSASSITSVQ